MELQMQRPVEGYPRLACHMGSFGSARIFRRFSSINCQNLLYLQAEIAHLETKLRRLEGVDKAAPDEHRRDYSRDWYWLNESRSDNGEQLRTVLEIRSKLKEYNEAVLWQSGMAKLKDPSKYDLLSIREWLETPNMGSLSLLGLDRTTWGEGNFIDPGHDLMSLNSGLIEDRFSRWLDERFLSWFHRIFWHRVTNCNADPESGIISYDTDIVNRTAARVTTIVASSLPILAISILYCVTSMNVRLGLVATFSIVFTTCLTFFTNIKRGEIFLATSTFAAVLVVFVSSSNGLNSSSV